MAEYTAEILCTRNGQPFLDQRYSRRHLLRRLALQLPPALVSVHRRQRGFRVDRYIDSASGSMTKNEAGKLAITRVTLRPEVVFSGENLPSREDISALHHAPTKSVSSPTRCAVKWSVSRSTSPWSSSVV